MDRNSHIKMQKQEDVAGLEGATSDLNKEVWCKTGCGHSMGS